MTEIVTTIKPVRHVKANHRCQAKPEEIHRKTTVLEAVFPNFGIVAHKTMS